jgi:hypothetical protein
VESVGLHAAFRDAGALAAEPERAEILNFMLSLPDSRLIPTRLCMYNNNE